MSEIIARPIVVRKRCLEIARKANVDVEEADEKKFSAMLGHLGAALKQEGNKADDIQVNRRLVQAFIFGDENKPFAPLSSKNFTPGQKIAMMLWVGSTFDESSGKWTTRSTFKAEANWILNIALYIYASTLQHQEFDTFCPNFGEMLYMYLGDGSSNKFIPADYWLKLAMELPGAILTKIYPEPIKKEKPEPAVGYIEEASELTKDQWDKLISYDFGGY